MKSSFFALGAGLALCSIAAFGNLIPIGTLPTQGNGLGAVFSVVTFANIGVEVGCIGVAANGSAETGSAQCYGGVTAPGGVTNEQTGAGNNVYSANVLGLASAGANTFANVVLIFNGNEGGNADAAITLEKLALNLFSTTGGLLGSYSTVDAFLVTAFTGTGTAGFGFQLDAAQASQANAVLALNPDLIIGVSAIASGANSGPETISISSIASVPSDDGTAVPEPSSIALIGGGLMGMALVLKRRATA